jgi:hypothetical protein
MSDGDPKGRGRSEGERPGKNTGERHRHDTAMDDANAAAGRVGCLDTE